MLKKEEKEKKKVIWKKPWEIRFTSFYVFWYSSLETTQLVSKKKIINKKTSSSVQIYVAILFYIDTVVINIKMFHAAQFCENKSELNMANQSTLP